MADFEWPKSPARLLLVEGPTDKQVVRNLRKRFRGKRSIPTFEIRETGGVDNLLSVIEAEIDVPGRRALGILVDANDTPADRWNAVTERVRRVRPDMKPGNPVREGTIIGGSPDVGIWLWPDNQSEGELEDFVAGMIPNDDPVWPLSRKYIDGIPKHCRKFAEKKTTRAQVHAWLATRETPGFIGSVVGEDDLEVDGALVTRFANWLRKLFG